MTRSQSKTSRIGLLDYFDGVGVLGVENGHEAAVRSFQKYEDDF